MDIPHSGRLRHQKRRHVPNDAGRRPSGMGHFRYRLGLRRVGNWVRFAHLSLVPRSGHVPPGGAGHRLGAPLRAIGFVFPMPLVGTIHHNSFPSKHLPFVSLEGKLGLFGAIGAREGPASEVPRPVPTRARIGRLGSFFTIGPSLARHPPDVPFCPSLALFRTIVPRPPPLVPPGRAGNWVCFA